MDLLTYSGSLVIFATGIVLSIAASYHALTTKREVRAAIGWMGLIWLVPYLGAALYALAGVNRIRRRGAKIRRQMHRLHPAAPVSPLAFGAIRPGPPLPTDDAETQIPTGGDRLAGLVRTTTEVTGFPLLDGSRIELLEDGDEAYPPMLSAIEGARSTIGLSSYIFDQDELGVKFVEALAGAVERGVEVRVLIDAVGGLYSTPTTTHILSVRGVPNAAFLRSLWPWRAPYFNLRNHRKILVVDGTHGFTGGINIRRGHLRDAEEHRIQDLHFRLEGPVVSHLSETFCGDWVFTTGELLEGPEWFPSLAPCGEVAARGIPDGPDEDFEALKWTLLGALAAAERSVRIITPYFLPDQTLVAALNLAALRGVTVDIVIPQENNLRVVGWAMLGQIRQVLKMGCRVWLSPPPFDHSKLMVVDEEWTLFGSANWDPRSLRLNFEFNVEAYDRNLAREAERVAWKKIRGGKRLTIEGVDKWPRSVQLRNSLAWLASPYL